MSKQTDHDDSTLRGICDHKLVSWHPFHTISEKGWHNMGWQARCSKCNKIMTNDDILERN